MRSQSSSCVSDCHQQNPSTNSPPIPPSIAARGTTQPLEVKPETSYVPPFNLLDDFIVFILTNETLLSTIA